MPGTGREQNSLQAFALGRRALITCRFSATVNASRPTPPPQDRRPKPPTEAPPTEDAHAGVGVPVLVSGLAGGVGAMLVLLALGVFLLRRRGRRRRTPAVARLTTSSLDDESSEIEGEQEENRFSSQPFRGRKNAFTLARPKHFVSRALKTSIFE